METRNKRYVYFRIDNANEDFSQLSSPNTLDDIKLCIETWSKISAIPKENFQIVKFHMPEKEYREKYLTGTYIPAERVKEFLEENEKYAVKSLREIAAEVLVRNIGFYKPEIATDEAKRDVDQANLRLELNTRRLSFAGAK